MTVKMMAGAASHVPVDWHAIDWPKAHRNVRRLQARIVKAVQEGWLKNWIATNFRGGKKNSDLWLRYAELAKKHNIKFKWVKGHADNKYNNRCDELATQADDSGNLQDDTGYEN